MRRPLSMLAVGIIGIVGAGTVYACSTPPPAPDPTSAETYPLAPRSVRPDERPMLVEGKDGDTGYTLIGMTSLPTIVGSHAEWPANGRFVRIRLVLDNRGRTSVLFDTRRQFLVLGDGSTRQPDGEAMLIKRQPTTFDLGAAVRVELDLYYDIPADAEPTALRAFGGPTLTDMKDEKGTDIPLK